MTRVVVLATLVLSSAAFAEEPKFAVKFDVPAAKAGQRTVVNVHVTPPSGFHLNKEFPTSLSFTPPSGITAEKAKLDGKDAKRFEEQGADFQLALVSSVEGKQTVSGELKFGVCSATACIPTREKVSFTLEVK